MTIRAKPRQPAGPLPLTRQRLNDSRQPQTRSDLGIDLRGPLLGLTPDLLKASTTASEEPGAENDASRQLRPALAAALHLYITPHVGTPLLACQKKLSRPPRDQRMVQRRVQNRGTNPVSSTESKTTHSSTIPSFLCCRFSVSFHQNLYSGRVIWTCAVREMLQLLARVPCKRKVRSEVDREGRDNRNNEQ